MTVAQARDSILRCAHYRRNAVGEAAGKVRNLRGSLSGKVCLLVGKILIGYFGLASANYASLEKQASGQTLAKRCSLAEEDALTVRRFSSGSRQRAEVSDDVGEFQVAQHVLVERGHRRTAGAPTI